MKGQLHGVICFFQNPINTANCIWPALRRWEYILKSNCNKPRKNKLWRNGVV